MSDKTVLLINRDGTLNPTFRVISGDHGRWPPRYKVVRARKLLGDPFDTVEYRLAGEVGPYVVYEEIS